MQRSLHLVLDLDETLVWANSLSTSVARPHLREFLDFCFAHFQSVNIWTAASREWWNLNQDLHFGDYPFALVFTGERCSFRWDYDSAFHRDPAYVPYKPLKKMWRMRSSGLTPHNTVIVDDDPSNAVKNYGNALAVAPFAGDPQDAELPKLRTRLEALLKGFCERSSVRKLQLHLL